MDIPSLFIFLPLFATHQTDSGAKVGCFNLLCPGFVQVDPVIGPKYVFSPVSSYGGPLHDFGILVYKVRRIATINLLTVLLSFFFLFFSLFGLRVNIDYVLVETMTWIFHTYSIY